jgi:hypothetical protein
MQWAGAPSMQLTTAQITRPKQPFKKTDDDARKSDGAQERTVDSGSLSMPYAKVRALITPRRCKRIFSDVPHRELVFRHRTHISAKFKVRLETFAIHH